MAEYQPITIDDTLTVIFSEATASPEARIRCSKLASTAFGKSLSLAGYLEREEYLGSLPLARGTGWRFWSLVRADDPEQILAMCKTLHRDLLVRDSQPGMRREQGYCICSVITDAPYRGRGLASVMLKHVAEWLDGPGNATASILYSEVGDFYVSRGWDMLDAFQSTLTATPSFPPQEQRAKLPETRLLTGDDIPTLCERDIEGLAIDFEKYDLAPDTILATVLPTADMLNWLQCRADFMNAHTNDTLPQTKGSLCESADAWLFWYHDLRHQQLIIQRVRPPPNRSGVAATQALARLLLDALEDAVRFEVPNVIVWNPSPELHKAMKFLGEEMGIEVTHEKRETKNVPCLRWRGGEKKSTVVWPNEFYPWS
ncbi:hypothetical protein F4677DRAFT_452146 [Hypoxylon crocopeplum]|nr:hypothetical protein F4677DRAFT_452146 [Hypoxylon crocopeplum]